MADLAPAILALIFPLAAPFIDNDIHDFLEKGDFDFGEVAFFVGGAAATAQHAVGHANS